MPAPKKYDPETQARAVRMYADRLAQEAERSGGSVGAVVREAIDLRFPDDENSRRATAARALLDLTSSTGGRHGEGPSDIKEAYAQALAAKAGAE